MNGAEPMIEEEKVAEVIEPEVAVPDNSMVKVLGYSACDAASFTFLKKFNIA